MDYPFAFLSPQTFEQIIAKDILFPTHSLITKMLFAQKPFPLLFYGESGVGKSLTIKLLAQKLNLTPTYFLAAKSNLKKLQTILQNNATQLLVIEEIHRLNKDKQDLLLPYLEQGYLIWASTTTNPNIALSAALKSRLFCYYLPKLTFNQLATSLQAYLSQRHFQLQMQTIATLWSMCNGDFRQFFAYLWLKQKYYSSENEAVFLQALSNNKLEHTNINQKNLSHFLSAFHKALRGSDPDAAIYYLGCLLAFGDLAAIFRRLYAVAYEDIGLANPAIVNRVNAAVQACEFLGMPEGKLPLSMISLELALSPKSNSAYQALKMVQKQLQQKTYPPPNHLTTHALTYKYPHNYPYSYIKQQYLPFQLQTCRFYQPNQYASYEQKHNNYWNKIKSKVG